MVKIKHRDFISAAPVMPYQNSSSIMGLRIYGEGRTLILLSSPAAIGPLQGSRIDRVYTDIKIANNNKINHIMVTFTDYDNAISIDRLSSKTKIGKDSWKRFMKIILLCKPEFSSTTKTSFFIKNKKNNHFSESDWWEYIKYCFTENAKILSKKSTTQDLVLKRMLELFLTVPPLKKILQFQERICFFFLKTQKTTSSASV